MHVTQVYSKGAVDWDVFGRRRNIITVGVGRRSVHQFEGGATVLRFESFKLRSRFRQFMDGGCTYDYDAYLPHITITYQQHGLNLDAIEPFTGDLILGPEIFEALDENWKDGIKESVAKAAPAQTIPRRLPPLPPPCPVHGHAHKARHGRPVHPAWRDPLDSEAGKRTEAAVFQAVHGVLRKLAPKVAKEIVAAVRAHPKRSAAVADLAKADDTPPPDPNPNDLAGHYSLDDALDAAHAVDLSDLDQLAANGELAETLGSMSEFSGHQILARIGVENNDQLVNQFNVDAYTDATDRAAELVGKKWVDGELVDNPDARWAINESTREQIAEAVVQSFQQGYGIDELQGYLEDSFGFSEARARMVARTESLRAANGGTKIALNRAKDAGVKLKKTWLASPDSCDDCLQNEDDGPIEMDETFSTGDSEPPAHPNCRCALSADVADVPDDATGDEEGDDEEGDE